MKYKALVVEEDAEIVGLIVDALASLEHACDVVSSQEEALKRLAAEEYAYMLLAIAIRARSGNGCARIQNTENLLERMSEPSDRPVPPVIIMSDHAVSGPELTVDVMRLAMSMSRRGAVDVIAKPFPHAGRTLDRVIKKVLRLARPDKAGCDRNASQCNAVPANAGGTTAPDRNGAGSLTVTQAAKKLMQDLPGLSLAKARSRISTAAGKGEFESVGTRRDRRIAPVSFDAWRLKQRDRDLDAEDEDDVM
jgi:DNA-binding response OmpR family regulator